MKCFKKRKRKQHEEAVLLKSKSKCDQLVEALASTRKCQFEGLFSDCIFRTGAELKSLPAEIPQEDGYYITPRKIIWKRDHGKTYLLHNFIWFLQDTSCQADHFLKIPDELVQLVGLNNDGFPMMNPENKKARTRLDGYADYIQYTFYDGLKFFERAVGDCVYFQDAGFEIVRIDGEYTGSYDGGGGGSRLGKTYGSLQEFIMAFPKDLEQLFQEVDCSEHVSITIKFRGPEFEELEIKESSGGCKHFLVAAKSCIHAEEF